jgi:type IV pilus assembly protein PilC
MTEKNNNWWNKLNKDIQIGKALPDKVKEHFYTEFAALLDAGMDIQRALELLIEEQDKQRRKAVYEKLRDDLVAGSSLAKAMEVSGHFSPYEYQSIRIGEESGKLRPVLVHLGKYFDDKVKLKRHLIGVFTYPAFVLLITIGVLYFMLDTVVPMFKEVFEQFGKELPYLTQQIVKVSENFTIYLYSFFGIIAAIVFLHFSQRKELWYRKLIGNIMISIPVFGKLFKKIYLARFTQSMSLLMTSRTPLVRSIELVKEMINFYPIEEALDSAKQELLMGNELHKGLAKYSIFDKRFISLIKIAEEINQLDVTFERMTKQYSSDIDHQTKLLGTLMEPFIIILIGAIVGVIMIAMYMPMFNMTDVIQ